MEKYHDGKLSEQSVTVFVAAHSDGSEKLVATRREEIRFSTSSFKANEFGKK